MAKRAGVEKNFQITVLPSIRVLFIKWHFEMNSLYKVTFVHDAKLSIQQIQSYIEIELRFESPDDF